MYVELNELNGNPVLKQSVKQRLKEAVKYPCQKILSFEKSFWYVKFGLHLSGGKTTVCYLCSAKDDYYNS